MILCIKLFLFLSCSDVLFLNIPLVFMSVCELARCRGGGGCNCALLVVVSVLLVVANVLMWVLIVLLLTFVLVL